MDYEIDSGFLEDFTINEIGEVFHNVEGLLPTFEKDGQTFVRLSKANESIEVQTGLLSLIKNKMSMLPKKHWHEVIVFYKDSDRTNNAPKNLSYRFKRLIESESQPGFYLIPGFETYGLSNNGLMVSLRTNKILKWSQTKPDEKKGTVGGYFYMNLFQERGYKNEFLHRLLGLVFLDLGRRICGLVINHKDGDPANNDLTNLEWVTIAENVKHSWDQGLCVANSIAILVKNLVTGEIQRYRSAKSCAAALGLSRESTVLFRLSKPQRLFRDRLQFKRDDNTLWLEVNTGTIVRIGAPQEIVSFNVFTNDRVLYVSGKEASVLTGISAVTIGKMALTRSKIPCKGLIFRFTDDDEFEIPDYTKEQLRFFMESTRRETKAVCLVSKDTTVFYRNIMVMGKELGYNFRELMNYLDSGKLWRDGCFIESISRNVDKVPVKLP